MKLKVRKEVVRCKKCKQENELLYLSDFSYGERLVLYDEGKKYAYINLLEDKVYEDFIKYVEDILAKTGVDNKEIDISQVINSFFYLACDNIDNTYVEFANTRRKCICCNSQEFEDIMVKPEEKIGVEFPSITHDEWCTLNKDEKINILSIKLKEKDII